MCSRLVAWTDELPKEERALLCPMGPMGPRGPMGLNENPQQNVFRLGSWVALPLIVCFRFLGWVAFDCLFPLLGWGCLFFLGYLFNS